MPQSYSSGWIPHSLLTLRLLSHFIGLFIGCLLAGPLANAEDISLPEGGTEIKATANTPPLTKALQDNAAMLALEQKEASANESWTRIEFTQWMVDPIVVAKPLNEQVNDPFVIGIRNIDTTGFEVRIRHCNEEDKKQPELLSYYILERGQYLLADETFMDAKQRFLWGKCKV
ncbi:MAG: hypothetical protein ACU4EQ_12145 [Candidatus Nitrosoglobus sp.]|jgi:hypothetical protein